MMRTSGVTSHGDARRRPTLRRLRRAVAPNATRMRAGRGGPGLRWIYGGGRRVTIALCCLLASVSGVVGFMSYGIAGAEPVLPGKAIDADTAQVISLAALSCPTLTGPRLAGQVMANSGFDPNASTSGGGTGVAGMSAATFQQWAPWAQASPKDNAADIYALAHYDCDLVGKTRHAKTSGDAWDNGLAAFQIGVDEVVKSGGVPSATQPYINAVHGYAAWYARQPAFTGTGQSASPSVADSANQADTAAVQPATGPQPVPDHDVTPVLAAGSVCAQISAVRVAAQLMASSGFNPNLRSANGAMGVAQFLPDIWNQYMPASSSPWDPVTAIPALGHAMCDLIRQLGALATDPYPLAVAAFQVGQTAIRQAGGVPNIPDLKAFVAQVISYADYYKQDTRLGGASSASPASPAPLRPTAAAPTPSRTPANTTGPAPQPPAPTSTTPRTPAQPPGTTNPPQQNPPPNPWTGRITGIGGNCLDLPRSDGTDGNQIEMWGCNTTDAQHWTIQPNGTLMAVGKCLDVQSSGTADGTNVQIWDCNGTAAQQWTLGPDGTIRALGKCLDVQWSGTGWGTKVWLWSCNGTAAQQWKRQ